MQFYRFYYCVCALYCQMLPMIANGLEWNPLQHLISRWACDTIKLHVSILFSSLKSTNALSAYSRNLLFHLLPAWLPLARLWTSSIKCLQSSVSSRIKCKKKLVDLYPVWPIERAPVATHGLCHGAVEGRIENGRDHQYQDLRPRPTAPDQVIPVVL